MHIAKSINNPSFTSRCPQIKEAQWVCHNVAVNFPHLSSTRISAFVSKIEDKYPKLYDEFIWENPSAGRFINLKTEQEKKIVDIFKWRKGLIRSINNERRIRQGYTTDLDKVYSLLSQLKYLKVGNCAENAALSELIMKLNGYKNVYTAAINVGKHQVDHRICFFNRDGSPFDGKIGKNTVIVDSWIEETDFADRMLVRYRNMYKDFLFIPKCGKLSFRSVRNFNLSNEELAQIASEFPELLKK